MRRELIVKTKSLAGSSDLTLLATIKPGLVSSLESVTYKTRVKRLLKALTMARASSHEYVLLRPFSDAVERVGKIHSVRVAVIEPEDKILLAVTFDGTWEAYIRVLWQKVGALLDVIFCNTVDYVSAFDSSFEEWEAWARRVQIESAVFYGMPGLTVDDVQYLRKEESVQRSLAPTPATDTAATQRIVQSPERRAWNAATDTAASAIEASRQGLQALAVLYRLTDLYLPGSKDGKFLQRAARSLLLEFVSIIDSKDGLPAEMKETADKRFNKQLTWLSVSDIPNRAVVPLPTVNEPAYVPHGDVQGGILRPYEGVTHGCLLLFGFTDRNGAQDFIRHLLPQVTRDDPAIAAGSLVMNVAFTCEGLRAIGLTEEQLGCFPQEFREGMEARASVLGDLRMNHPRRWQLPVRNWPTPPAAGVEKQRVELSAVHVVVQLRIGDQSASEEVTDPQHPLHPKAKELAGHPGVRLLSAQTMLRHLNPAGKAQEHFGFADGDGQPVLDPAKAGVSYPNQIHLGELLIGYPNDADQAPDPAGERLAWLKNGSFLVVRKLAQNVRALEDAVAIATRPGLDRDGVLTKMMGRTPAGDPAVAPGSKNDFDYRGDSSGSKCPFQAHIRRANPRESTPAFHEPPGQRTPRLMRRSMSYGPRYDLTNPANPVNAKERGMVFMAYNASIGEQFEVVQRWLSGGNSTGVSSAQSDPFLGVAENGEPRVFRFAHGNEVVRMKLDGASALLDDPVPLVRLEWGAYLFAPSIAALEKLMDADANTSPMGSANEWEQMIEEGQRQIDALQALEWEHGAHAAADAWKSVLEDPASRDNFISASVWAAIRECHGGVLRTPYGVLVAERSAVMEVFADPHARYTVSGYHGRMMRSMGEIYLGLDRLAAGGAYDQQATATNAAIQAISEQDAFEAAHRYTSLALKSFIDDAKTLPNPSNPSRWELNLDVREVTDKVLANLCQEWFGLPPSGGPVEPGSARWDWDPAKDKPLYPGNFTAPSRYIFQPRPGAEAEHYGCVYGATLTKAFVTLVAGWGGTPPSNPNKPDGVPARIAAGLFKAYENPAFGALPRAELDALVARTFVGALMGFLPTVDGNLRLSLNEWLIDGTFWSLRAALAEQPGAAPYSKAGLLRAPLLKAMQLRPSPELVWRTAVSHHSLGAEGFETPVEPGDKVVISVVSATQQCLKEGSSDIYAVFGGERAGVHPTHACPGYAAAMGVMLGILCALLEAQESMRPSPAPLAFTFDGPF